MNTQLLKRLEDPPSHTDAVVRLCQEAAETIRSLQRERSMVSQVAHNLMTQREPAKKTRTEAPSKSPVYLAKVRELAKANREIQQLRKQVTQLKMDNYHLRTGKRAPSQATERTP